LNIVAVAARRASAALPARLDILESRWFDRPSTATAIRSTLN
jgi:hypothetical protein